MSGVPGLSSTLNWSGPAHPVGRVLVLLFLASALLAQEECPHPCPDADSDGVCDAEDMCPGGDDTIDTDNDGFPDACRDFVRVSGAGFSVNGVPFHHVGTNTYYLMTYASDPALRHHVDEVLDEAVAMGLTVIRTWAFNDGDGWNALQTSPSVYDERVFQGLDYVLDRCDRLGLRVILPLVNNWSDYGGMNQYVAWSPTASYHDDFYTDVYTRAYYQAFAAAMANRVNTQNGRRYRDDPTIMAWELANEPRCVTDPSGDTIANWIQGMSAYLKSVDPNHLVTTGIEGFFNDADGPWYLNGSQGVDFFRDHLPATVDFATAHSWPESWSLDDETTFELLDRQILEAATLLEKPFVLEEFGASRDETGETTERDVLFETYLDAIYSSRSAGALYWTAYHDEYPDYDGYGVYYPADMSTLEIIEHYAAQMTALSF